MNLPNQLTVSRLLLTGVFVACFYLPWENSYSIAVIVFGAASFTDYLDGAIARARNLVTNFGKLFDPLALWQAQCDGLVTGHAMPAGHFIPEELPAETADEVLRFFGA